MPPPNPNANTPRPTQLPAQPVPNPNSKTQQLVYSINPNQYPAYVVSISDIHLRSGTTLLAPSSPVITEIPTKGVEKDNLPSMLVPPSQTQESDIAPSFPQRLEMEVIKKMEEPMFDLIDQLKHVCVKIPLFQAIKGVAIYSKAIKEACLKKPGRKKKDPQTVHVIGQLANIMLGKVIIPKYSSPRSLVVRIDDNGIQVQNALIDLGAAINVMPKDVMQHLNITTLRPAPIVLQLANSSIVRPNGDMTISDGMTTKKLALYPPTKPQLDLEQPVWPNIGEEADEANSVAQLMMIDRDPFLQLQEENEILSNILQNHYGAINQLDGCSSSFACPL
ncbi:uncharacterized protein LOC131860349 [Cryptomeria japonica]|uniref:uncharacterized protein LOC131860349 n=1 Tax=Cryptomeria japonica TaxID=3369 RepID=UPI0027DA8F61|nr:uncharacterized protein LOC131860349 [Cryptomeria japonica]